MTYETITTKTKEGWEAVTRIELAKVEHDTMGDKVDNGTQFLEISTRKGTYGIQSFASVFIEHESYGRKCKTFAFPDDYLKSFNLTQARASEKTVKEIHAKTMADIEQILIGVAAFYETKKAKAA